MLFLRSSKKGLQKKTIVRAPRGAAQRRIDKGWVLGGFHALKSLKVPSKPIDGFLTLFYTENTQVTLSEKNQV